MEGLEVAGLANNAIGKRRGASPNVEYYMLSYYRV